MYELRYRLIFYLSPFFLVRALRIDREKNDGNLLELKDTERTGLLALYDYSHFFYMLIRSEGERQAFLYLYLGDLVKGGRVYAD